MRHYLAFCLLELSGKIDLKLQAKEKQRIVSQGEEYAFTNFAVLVRAFLVYLTSMNESLWKDATGNKDLKVRRTVQN